MAQPRTPPELNDDAIEEILVRIPPDESAHLARASLVCKLWRRILSDPGFTSRYREFHRTPPLLGFFHNTDSGRLFFPTTPASQPAFDCSRWWTLDYRQLCALDCRHGRVVLRHLPTRNHLVWDPITGGLEELPEPHVPYVCYDAMVLCAAAGSCCDHGGCAGGPFLVVFVGILDGKAHCCVYSSEARAWGTPVSLYLGCNYEAPVKRGALVAEDAYFIMCRCSKILKYDFAKNRLSTIDPPGGFGWNIITMPTDDGLLGFAGIKGSNLYLWSRKKVNSKGEAAKWLQCRVLELEKLLPAYINCNRARVIGFAEGVGVMFVRIDKISFMIELKSGGVRKVRESKEFCNVLPFMSFYTPGMRPLYQHCICPFANPDITK